MGHLKLEVSFLSYLAKGGVGRGILSEAPPTVQREELGLCSFRFLSKLLVKTEAKVCECGEVVVEPTDGKRVCGSSPAFLCLFMPFLCFQADAPVISHVCLG